MASKGCQVCLKMEVVAEAMAMMTLILVWDWLVWVWLMRVYWMWVHYRVHSLTTSVSSERNLEMQELLDLPQECYYPFQT